MLLLSLALFGRRRWLSAKLDQLHADIGYVRRDSQLHTPLAILLNMLLALPLSLLLALGGLALQMDARGQNAALGAALLQMAQAWLVFYTAYRVMVPGGVAERHFQWPVGQVRELHRYLRRLGLVVLAVVAIVTLAERQPEALAQDVLGILTLLAGYATMAWLMVRLLVHKSQDARPSPLRVVIGFALALMPLTLIVALVMGYYYTALKLTGRLIDTLFLLILWRLLEATLVRALAVAARRLDYQRAVARREAAERERQARRRHRDHLRGPGTRRRQDQPAVAAPAPPRPARRPGGGAVLGVGRPHHGVRLPRQHHALRIRQRHRRRRQRGADQPADVIGALVIAAIAFMLATNLPGLLEVLVLSRLKLAQGSAYAITTLLSYVIVGVGIAATLGTLGVSWDKLQWLVAALSVGLGFGLQEIFANFVSGLIILFERPLRIGDVVTIGNVSGTGEPHPDPRHHDHRLRPQGDDRAPTRPSSPASSPTGRSATPSPG